MKKKSASRSAFFNSRVISFVFCAICALLALLAFGLYPGGNALARQRQSSVQDQSSAQEFTEGNLQSLQIPDASQGSGSEIAPNNAFIPAAPLVASCPLTVLVNDGSTSGNARAPSTRYA